MSYPGAPQIRVGQWNAPLYMDSGDPLGDREIELLIIRPDNTSCGGPAMRGKGNVYTNELTMLEGNWVFYMIREGDLTVPGTYTTQLNITPGLEALQVPQAQFVVSA